MEQQIITGYHATNKNNESSIINFGYDISKCKEDEQWLGKGIYFWESLYYAIEWNYINSHSFSRSAILKKIINDKTIFVADIFIEKDRMLDLSSPEGTIIFEEFQKVLKENLGENEIKEAYKRDDVCWIYILQKYGFFEKFDIVIATYKKEIKSNAIKSPRNFERYVQKQICVKKINNIINNRIYNDIDRIKYYFQHIHNNRTSSSKLTRR